MKKHHSTSSITIWLVGGGTGGHIVPLLAVAEELKRHPHVSLSYVGDALGPERALAEQAGLPFIALPTGKLRRYVSFRALYLNGRDMIRLGQGVLASMRLIRRHHPDIIFSKGGPVALPVALAARITQTRLITHESDAVIGLTNRIIARSAKVILTAFPATVYPNAYAAKIIAVGVPLRREFTQPAKTQPARTRPMVLITGGSQGALAINQAIAAILPQLLTKASVMHITGATSYEHFRALKASLPPERSDYYGVIDYTNDMAAFMREATLVVSRASSTIFELATLGKPMILIPLPTSANDHQRKNAEIFAQRNAAIVLLQENLTPERLYETISSVLTNHELQQELKEGTRLFACPDAAKQVAELLLRYAKEDKA